MDDVSLKLIGGSLFSILIVILFIAFSIYTKKKGNYVENKTHFVDFGQIYFRNCLCTFAPMLILCDDIYKFLVLQAGLLFAAIINAKYVNNKRKNQ